MAKSREEKQKIIEDLEKEIKKRKTMIFIDFSNLNSESLFDLRDKLEKSDCLLKVAKKTLLEKTLENIGEKNLADKIKEIKTQLALVFGPSDGITPAKICYQFSKKNEQPKILAGVIDNQFLEKEKIIELAQLPSKEELMGKLAGSLNSPILQFVNVLKNNIKGLLYVLAKVKT